MAFGDTNNLGQYQGLTFDPRFDNLKNGQQSQPLSGVDQNSLDPLFNNGQQQLSPFSRGIKNFSLGAEAFTGLAGVYQANQLRKRGDKQFGIERDIIDRNLANESLAYNDQVTQRAISGLAFRGIDPGSPQYQQELARLTQGRFVDGSPVAN